MKVAHLTSVHPVFDARIFQRECKSLVRLGCEVVLVAPHGLDEIVEGVQIRAVHPLQSRILRLMLTAFRVFRRALHENADIYHFHDPELIPVGLLLRMLGRRVIYDIHEDLPRTIESKFYLRVWCRRPLKWAAEWVEDFACRWFSALVVATPTIARRFCDTNPRTIVVCNFPVLKDFPRSEAPWSDRTMSVAYIGSIPQARGIHELVRAMSLLPSDSPVRMTLAGRFWSEALHAELAQLPGWNRVDYVGSVHPSEVPHLLSCVRAGVVVLRPVENYVCSMPIKLFEYMAAGIPVIASDFPLWREIVDGAKCGLLVDPSSPADIAHAIQSLISSPEQAQQMGARGRTATEVTYNWKSQEGRLHALYSALSKTVVSGQARNTDPVPDGN
ncbi:MAG: glycosyltransferase family 4 protein [Acidobacteriia bacterium]|nr:glycosyltransferase family 4 protein [Terriglobia bacterium]